MKLKTLKTTETHKKCPLVKNMTKVGWKNKKIAVKHMLHKIPFRDQFSNVSIDLTKKLVYFYTSKKVDPNKIFHRLKKNPEYICYNACQSLLHASYFLTSILLAEIGINWFHKQFYEEFLIHWRYAFQPNKGRR